MRSSTKVNCRKRMKTFRALALMLACGAILRADYSYRSKTRIAGAVEVSTILMKGNRMAALVKDHIDVFDLDKQTITTIELSKKTYQIVTFAQKKHERDSAAEFKAVVNATGANKKIGVLNTKEVVLTVTAGPTDISVDTWIATVPGYDDVRQFHRALGDKLGYELNCGLAPLHFVKPEILPAFAEACTQTSKLQGAPLQSTLKIVESGTAVIEITTELTNFSAGPVDASKFEVPLGFTKAGP